MLILQIIAGVAGGILLALWIARYPHAFGMVLVGLLKIIGGLIVVAVIGGAAWWAIDSGEAPVQVLAVPLGLAVWGLFTWLNERFPPLTDAEQHPPKNPPPPDGTGTV